MIVVVTKSATNYGADYEHDKAGFITCAYANGGINNEMYYDEKGQAYVASTTKGQSSGEMTIFVTKKKVKKIDLNLAPSDRK
jgi:hypothetical protein